MADTGKDLPNDPPKTRLSGDFIEKLRVHEDRLAPWSIIIDRLFRPAFSFIIIFMGFAVALYLVVRTDNPEIRLWAQNIIASVIGMAIGVWSTRPVGSD